MKIKSLSAFLMLSMFCMLACKKSSTVPNSDPAYVGFWQGKYGSGAFTYPTNAYSMVFRNNGTFRVIIGSDTATATLKGEGQYTISNDTIKGIYSYPNNGGTYPISALKNSKNTFMEGTWGNNVTGGLFFLVKQ